MNLSEPRVVKPGSAAEVARTIIDARKDHEPVFVMSSGKKHRHWRGPAGGDGLVVDMSAMARVVRLDRRNRAALVEPGVTFGTFSRALEGKGLRANTPLAPRASKSVLASALEREPVIMPRYHWDMVDPLMSIEVVLGTGDLFRAGSGAGPGSLQEQWASGQAQKSPMGPSQFDPVRLVQGSQGTMGVVTWASIRVEQAPARTDYLLSGSEDLATLCSLVQRLSWRRLGEECLILNSGALGSLLETDPANAAALANSLPPWVLLLGLAGFAWRPDERVAYQRAEAVEIARALGLSAAPSLGGLSADRVGRAAGATSAEPYWKDRALGDSDEVFFLATLDRAAPLISVARDKAAEAGYPSEQAGAYVQPLVGGRAAHVEVMFPHEPGKAPLNGTSRSLSRALLDAGAFFSRPYGDWADLVWERDPRMKRAVEKIKGIFDPDGIMSPGNLGIPFHEYGEAPRTTGRRSRKARD
ncbi:MAG: FAD-binding protein [Actinobacteria bacterium]|nr:FAD-binding protein [Actinomycetota bacterium]MBU1944221.1 FAD-binding protein [Actinomycetota bacterium]MBU2688386.1 FAD-binding protein [Actinomycetota bacterium]